jgi:hypothetical protein
MLGDHGDQLMRLLGREPAERGIIETSAMPAALAALEAAIAAEAAAGQTKEEDADAPPSVALRQRLWPMVEMLRMSHAAGQPVVWGV